MRMKFLLLMSVAATLVGVLAVRPSDAGSFNSGDEVYADSTGNLVIESEAGYKRIIVGQGHRAKELRQFVQREEPTVVYSEEDAGHRETCYRPAMWLRGRSHMYGLSPGELPLLGECR
jgi:hypothetical protein